MKKIIFLAFAILLAACTEKQPVSPDSSLSTDKPVVMTSNYPLYFFTHEIAGESIDVRFPEIDGDPAMWAPSGAEAGQLQGADLLILNGAGYESWLAFTTLPAGHSLDTTAQLQDNLLAIENETKHQHGPAGEHSHPGTAFTTWLDPQLAIEQARAIMQGLSRLAPEQSEIFRTNFENLEQRLEQLDRSFAQAFAELGGRPVLFSHPVYQYLQHRYKINARSTHWEADIEPGTKDWIDFGKLLRDHPAKVMIWEESPIEPTRNNLLQRGLDIVVFRPAGNQLTGGDYFTVMEQNLLELTTYTRQFKE